MKKDELTEILGYEPGRALRLMILQDCKEKKISIGEAASFYQLPEMFIVDDNGLIEFKGEKMTLAKFKEKHPFKKLVTIGTKKRNNKIIS